MTNEEKPNINLVAVAFIIIIAALIYLGLF